MRNTSCVLGALAVLACARREAPLEAFEKPEYRAPVGGQAFTPPAAALAGWRVLMLQVEPRPKKNPQWTDVSAGASGELEMPAGSAFRCIYNPAKFRGAGDESMKGLEAWDVIREVRCSNDGWRTYSSAGLKVVYDGEGKVLTRSGDQAELALFETISGRPTKISVLLKPGAK